MILFGYSHLKQTATISLLQRSEDLGEGVDICNPLCRQLKKRAANPKLHKKALKLPADFGAIHR
jgi:hypothetical protein